MIGVKKPFLSLWFCFFYCVLNIVPIALIALEAAIKRREEKIFAFLEIRQNFEAYLQEFIFGKNELLYRCIHHSLLGSKQHHFNGHLILSGWFCKTRITIAHIVRDTWVYMVQTAFILPCNFSGITILLSNCFLLLHVMIAFSFAFILSFWHYVCGYNVHLKNNPVLQFFWKFLSDLQIPRTKSVTNVTFPGHTEIFYNLALTCWHLSHLMDPSFVSNNR